MQAFVLIHLPYPTPFYVSRGIAGAQTAMLELGTKSQVTTGCDAGLYGLAVTTPDPCLVSWGVLLTVLIDYLAKQGGLILFCQKFLDVTGILDTLLFSII